MSNPWDTEINLDCQALRGLLESCFPTLGIRSVEYCAEGWDNIVYLVNEDLIFRVPKRAVASDQLDKEVDVLSKIADEVSLPLPKPLYVGKLTGDRAWTFFGYKKIVGREICELRLSIEQRGGMVEPLALFLKELHAIDPVPKKLDKYADVFERLNITKRIPQAEQRFKTLQGANLIVDPSPWLNILTSAEGIKLSGKKIVHGDLHFRHVLVLAGKVEGVIDWGDAHCGDPAVDLHLAFAIFSPAQRHRFFELYGAITDEQLKVARAVCVYISAALAVYAHDTGNEAVKEGALSALKLAMEE